MKTDTTIKVKYRIRVVPDEDATFEECNGESRPLTPEEYRENYYNVCPDHPVSFCQCDPKLYRPMTYAEYLQYYGAPERHVYVGVVVDRLCECCQQYTKGVGSLWRIDFMDDAPECAAIGYSYGPDRLPGYLQDVARELISELEA